MACVGGKKKHWAAFFCPKGKPNALISFLPSTVATGKERYMKTDAEKGK